MSNGKRPTQADYDDETFHAQFPHRKEEYEDDLYDKLPEWYEMGGDTNRFITDGEGKPLKQPKNG